MQKHWHLTRTDFHIERETTHKLEFSLHKIQIYSVHCKTTSYLLPLL
jgi:hypothetical protein